MMKFSLTFAAVACVAALSAFAGFTIGTVNDMGATDYTDANAAFWDASAHTGAVVCVATASFPAIHARPQVPLASAGQSGFDARAFVAACGYINGASTVSRAGLIIIAR